MSCLSCNPMWKRVILRIGMCFFVAFFQVMPIFASDKPVGFIEIVGGTFSGFKLIRDGKPVKVKLHSYVYNADKIILLKQNVKVKLLLASDKKPVILTYDNKEPYTVNVVVKDCGKWCSVMNWVDNLINDPPPKRASAKSKGSEIEVHVLNKSENKDDDAQNNKLEAGKKTVHFAWYGGQAPYTITFKQIRSQNMKTWHCPSNEICSFVITGSNAEDRLFRIAIPQRDNGFKFETGKSYYIIISDKYGASAERSFTVAPNTDKPCSSFADLAGNKKWQFEAYQQTFSKESGIAEIIKMGFESGSRP